MIAASLWAYVFLSTACVSAYDVDHKRSAVTDAEASVCGTHIDLESSSASEAYARRGNAKQVIRSRQADNSSVLLPVDVYMQVLSTDGTELGGDISDATIDAQMQILDDAFRPVGFKFNLVDTVRTINEEWYYNLKIATTYEDEVSLALRKGGNATLNIYTMGGLNTTTLAWATVASQLQYRAAYDGVFLNGTGFLGGSDPTFTKGITLVHEVGHWFGLYHNFASGCRQSYDYVDDTPIEDQPNGFGGCPIGRDSCPDQPGLDLIHNYMSYFDDDCRNSWTPGQIQRMREQMAKFRDIVYPGIDVNDIPEDSL
ncbi:zincin [Dothidotthia symphoricarpi CBS 119687]|uniref:Zincin n=1 Tax=Dothidotthia symphoricarpi CBS 119687 TaxID=1392245 RepID=A0A6A5ZX46_9PLEO|nr:zincin [Dothidotthia symphoricarpi CBS 119687]KAF2124332.1 zincin [Dothidotthia symphoricarpi CBS 119687]